MEKTSSKSSQEATELLMADHKKVQKMFKDFEKIEDEDEKFDVVAQICTELTIHAQIEEEIFYPAVRAAIDDDDLMDEAAVEHQEAKELISQLQSMEPGDELYDAKVTVLGEYVGHHIEEEQNEMFPKAKKAKVDLDSLGQQLVQRKEELQSELGMAEASSGATRTRSGSSSRKSSSSPSRRGSH
ncbi:MAG TPA: hemerythrin domain-containing protein [Methylophilaceae bacterium]|nr:hemerythrin domain-containing protein [Methylophilaceae bacterium]